VSVLAIQRCLHHPAREAVARCAECGCSFCRECIAEHDQRIICATCLQRLLKPAEMRRRPWGPVFRRLAGSFGGIILAWICFYCLGRMLLMMPSTFHVEMWGDPNDATEVRTP
jgi:hypothetical protein